MYACVRKSVCMYVYMCGCVCMHVFVCDYVCMYVCTLLLDVSDVIRVPLM